MPLALIVDDEPEANKLLAMIVQLHGMSTESSFTGQHAIETISAIQPDVVMLDLMLPDMSGLLVCEAIKSSKSTALTPVVMVTARLASENLARSFAHGADQYVAKPYLPQDIYHAIDESLRWSSSTPARGSRLDASIMFKSDEPESALREISRLSSLLVARTPLDPSVVRRLDKVLRSFQAKAAEWSRRRQEPHVAALRYQSTDKELTLDFEDRSGWLGEGALKGGSPPAIGSSSIDLSGLECQVEDDTWHCVARFD